MFWICCNVWSCILNATPNNENVCRRKENGTEQLLITSPRSMVEITLGKFFAGVLVTVIAELLTFVYFGILCVFKTPDVPATLTAMFGFLLISMAYIAFGMFMSSLTENQIVAGVITIAAFILTWIAPTVTSGLESLSLMAKFSSFYQEYSQ